MSNNCEGAFCGSDIKGRHGGIRRGILDSGSFAPISADAAEYCVHAEADACTGQVDQGADLQAALDAAADSSEADTIHIGPGEYLAPRGRPSSYVRGKRTAHRFGSGAGAGGTVLKAEDGNIAYTLMVQSRSKDVGRKS